MNAVSSREIGGGNCVIGNTHICPRDKPPTRPPRSASSASQQLNFWMQVYNLGIDEATKSNQATVTYQIIDAATNTVIFEKAAGIKGLGGAQRPVDCGENSSHGWPAARKVQGDDQSK